MKLNRIINVLKALAKSIEPVANARVASVILYKNRPISFGWNRHKSHPFQAKYGKNDQSIYSHSETINIYNALKSLSVEELRKCTMVILRVKCNGDYGLAKPCSGCQDCIDFFGIKKVIYSTNEGDFKCLEA